MKSEFSVDDTFVCLLFTLVLLDEIWFEESFSVFGFSVRPSAFDEVVSGCLVYFLDGVFFDAD